MGKFIAGYIGSLLLFIATIFAFVVFLFTSIGDIADQPQYLVPGSHTIECKYPGTYAIFHLYTSKKQGIRNHENALDGMNFFLVDESNDTLYTSEMVANSSFTANASEGKGVRTFRIETPGTYTITGQMDSADHLKNGNAAIVILHNFTKDLFRTVFTGIAIMGSGMLLSFALFILTIIKHIVFVQNRKKTQQ